MESPPRATTKRASKHRSSYTKELEKLKAILDEWKTKRDTDNANFEQAKLKADADCDKLMADLKTIREEFVAGLSKFFTPSHDSSPILSSTPLQDGYHEDGEKTVEQIGRAHV